MLFGDLQPVKSGGDAFGLSPNDFLRPRVAAELRHPRECFGVFSVHPVSHFGVDAHEVRVSVWIVLAQIEQQIFPFGRDLVAFVCAVFAAYKQAKADVAQVVGLGVVGMSGHHGGRRPAIRHTGCELIDAVASCGVAH